MKKARVTKLDRVQCKQQWQGTKEVGAVEAGVVVVVWVGFKVDYVDCP